MISLKIKNLFAVSVLFGAIFTATSAVAAPVNTSCPDPAISGSRVFTITTDPGATCLAWGVGNINGNPAIDPFLMSAIGTGYQLIDKSDTADGIAGYNGLSATNGGLNSGLSGTISLTYPTIAQTPIGQ